MIPDFFSRETRKRERKNGKSVLQHPTDSLDFDVGQFR